MFQLKRKFGPTFARALLTEIFTKELFQSSKSNVLQLIKSYKLLQQTWYLGNYIQNNPPLQESTLRCRLFSQVSASPQVEEEEAVSNEIEPSEKPPPVRAMHPSQSQELVKKGTILEIRRENRNILVVVARQEGPKTWLAMDQDSKPLLVFQNQISLVLPGSSYTPQDVKKLNEKVAATDRKLIQLSWESMGDELRAVNDRTSKLNLNLPQITKKLFGNVTSETLYVSHRILSEDTLYFKQVGRLPPVYEPRTLEDVDMIQGFRKKQQENDQIFSKLKDTISNTRDAPKELKPQKKDWQAWGLESHVKDLELFALCKSTPEVGLKVLHACGFEASPAGAAQCLHQIGYWPPHVQLPILRLDLDRPFPDHVEEAAKLVYQHPRSDMEKPIRLDLTNHRVVTIDDSKTTEVDDGLSVEHLSDGQTRVWIHIADPTRHFKPDDVLDMTARDRCKSVYVATGMIPMFPLSLAEGIFSLNLDCECSALSVGVIIKPDGVVEEYEIHPSTIRPTIKLTYDQTDQILEKQDLQETDPDLFALHSVAQTRFKYRTNRGSVQVMLPECEPYVEQIDIEDPEIDMRVITIQSARTLVAEMMILAGEVVARFGGEHRIPLPYKGQLQPVGNKEPDFNELPEGHVKEAAKRLIMARGVFSPSQPLRHSGLGLDHYVQVSSPIRRYGDVIAHFQIKSFLSGRTLPFTAPQIQQIMDGVNDKSKELTRVEGECRRYWIAEYFRQNKKSEFKGVLCRWIRQDFGLGQAIIEDLGIEAIVKVHSPKKLGEQVTLKVGEVNVPAGIFRLEEPYEGSLAAAGTKLEQEVVNDGAYVDTVLSNNPYNY